MPLMNYIIFDVSCNVDISLWGCNGWAKTAQNCHNFTPFGRNGILTLLLLLHSR